MTDDLKEVEASIKRISDLANHYGFDIYFPLPYRICVAIIVGIWLWGLNVKILTAAHVDVGQLVKYSFTTGPANYVTQSAPRTRHEGIYQMATVFSLAVGFSWIIFLSTLTFLYRAIPALGSGLTALDLLPLATLLLLIASFFTPGRRFHSSGRRRFLEIARRISVGDLDRDCRFADILVADALTSYTRVLLDLVVAVCMLGSGQSCVGQPDRSNCSGPITMLVVLSIPSLIRFRQCTIDFARTGATSHLVNCMKYGSAIPVVVFGALQKVYTDADSGDGGGLSATSIYQMWLLASLVNSVYSFIWDIGQDWGLELVGMSPLSYLHGGLRKELIVRPVSMYYCAIAVDFGLRMLWTIKLTTNWSGFGDYESGLFVLELLEIFRRGMWICFRTEKEWVFTTMQHIPVRQLPALEMEEFHGLSST